VSLSVSEPGLIGVMGPSGSGKSTLLHLLAGLDWPDQGSVIVGGTDITNMPERKLTRWRRENVGVVFQQFNLIPTLSAKQNVTLPGVIAGRPRKELDKRADELLEQLGLTGRTDHRPEAMSGGEQQRVAIARAMLFSPSVLLADEPTGNLDSANSQRIWVLLSDLAKDRQMTVLMVTHEAAAAAHCRHVYVIGDGQLQGDFEVGDLDAAGVASRYQQLGR
jgi:putative ABC transport system ATP-binding protein